MRCVGTQDAVQVDTLVFDVVANDMLVLCSDGLSQYLKNSQELARLWGGRSPKDFTRALITVANARGGSDNVSVICVRPDSSLPMGATPGPPAPAAVAGRRNAAIAATNPPRSRAREPVLVTLDTLRGIHVMAALSAQEVMLLRQVFRERSFGVGAYITREGEVGTEMFVLLEGLAEVLRGEERVAELGPGAHFGEMALLNDKPRAASVLTMSACRTLVCGRGELSDLLTEHPTLAARFYRELACALSTRLDDIYAFYDKGDTQVADEEPGRARTTLFHGSGHHGH
jgi:hypothetical protein